jgi:hypothetical protein
VKAYPRSFVPFLWWLAAFLLLSGLLLIPGMLALRLEWDVSDAWVGPRSWYAGAHGLLAFIALLLMGALLAIHVRHGLRQKYCRKSGLTLLFALPLPVLSGWGIYYISNESWARAISLTHAFVGLALGVLLPIHWLAGRARRQKA